MRMTHTQKMALLDARDTTLRLLADRRTVGRMRLYHAVRALAETLVPPYAVRKALRDATLQVGRAS